MNCDARAFTRRIRSGITQLAQVLIGSVLICIVIYYSFGFISNTFAQNTEIICSNPGFETGNLQCWQDGGDRDLIRIVQTKTVFAGSYAALIGDPFTTRKRCEGQLPLGNAWISYVITVPIQGEPYFSFNYRVFSYDEIVEGKEDRFDRFDVYIDDLSDSMPRFRVLRVGSDNGQPPSDGKSHPCDFTVDDSNWLTATWKLSSVQNFDNLNQIYDLRGKTIKVIFRVFSQEEVGNSGWYNTWVLIDNLKLQPEMTLSKSSDPQDLIHEGTIITYTISYANTSFTTQTITITDQIPFNAILQPGTIYPIEISEVKDSQIIWKIGDIAPGKSGQVSFQVQVPLLPDLSLQSASHPLRTPQGEPYVIPNAIQCDSTKFWMVGLLTTVGPTPTPTPTPTPDPCRFSGLPCITGAQSEEIPNFSLSTSLYIVHVEIPPGSNPSTAWLLMREEVNPNSGPWVENQLATKTASIPGASVWAAEVTQTMVDKGSIQVTTEHPNQLDAILLFEGNLPPFDLKAVTGTSTGMYKQTYTFDVPSVSKGQLNVLYPILDVIAQPQRMTTVTVEFNGNSSVKKFTQPNMNDGLTFISFPFDLHEFNDELIKKLPVTVSLETEDPFVWSLGPRVCRPVYIENTAWLCSKQAGCISSTVRNSPPHLKYPHEVYLPIIMKP